MSKGLPKKILLIVIGLYLLAPVPVYLFQGFILFPGGYSEERQTIAKQNSLFVEQDGVKLQGWLIERPITSEKPLLIFYGGNPHDVAAIPELFAKKFENSILTFNYRGIGKSEGRGSEEAWLSDATFILNKFTEQLGISKNDVVVIGMSLGTGIASHIVSTEQIKGAVFITPFDSLPSAFNSYLPFYPEWLFWKLGKHHFDNASRVSRTDIPALIVEARDDMIIPSRGLSLFEKAYAGPKTKIIVQSGHFDVLDVEELYPRIEVFLKSIKSVDKAIKH